MLGEVVDARADQPAEERREDDLVRPVDRLAELLEAPRDHRARRDEAEGEHDPERLERQRAEVDLGLHRRSDYRGRAERADGCGRYR